MEQENDVKIEYMLGVLIALAALLLPGRIDDLKLNDEIPIYEAADQSPLDMTEEVTLEALRNSENH